MTTTLRPTEPLQRRRGSGPVERMSRRFQVCVNSRPVGTILLATHPGLGPVAARIEELHIDEPDRRRGRATVAALAAEEVARGWGCRALTLHVPVGSPPALRLATALGYTQGSRILEKPLLTDPPPLPPGTRTHPLTDHRPFAERSYARFARNYLSRAGVDTEISAWTTREREAFITHPPAEATLTTLEHEGTQVGTLWLTLEQDRAFVTEVEVPEEFRGRGHGRTLMHVAEAQAIEATRHQIALNVFEGNTAAERLYESLGYTTSEYRMYKALL